MGYRFKVHRAHVMEREHREKGRAIKARIADYMADYFASQSSGASTKGKSMADEPQKKHTFQFGDKVLVYGFTEPGVIIDATGKERIGVIIERNEAPFIAVEPEKLKLIERQCTSPEAITAIGGKLDRLIDLNTPKLQPQQQQSGASETDVNDD